MASGGRARGRGCPKPSGPEIRTTGWDDCHKCVRQRRDSPPTPPAGCRRSPSAGSGPGPSAEGHRPVGWRPRWRERQRRVAHSRVRRRILPVTRGSCTIAMRWRRPTQPGQRRTSSARMRWTSSAQVGAPVGRPVARLLVARRRVPDVAVRSCHECHTQVEPSADSHAILASLAGRSGRDGGLVCDPRRGSVPPPVRGHRASVLLRKHPTYGERADGRGARLDDLTHSGADDRARARPAPCA